MLRITLPLLLVFFSCCIDSTFGQATTYRINNIDTALLSKQFSVSILNKQNPKSEVYVSWANNDTSYRNSDQLGKSFNYTIFSFSDMVTVEVTKIGSYATHAIIRPDRLGIGRLKTQITANGCKVRFTISKPSKISVEFNDDMGSNNALAIFANEPEKKFLLPNKAAKNVFVVAKNGDFPHIPKEISTVFFPPGMHNIGFWKIPPSVKQVYIAGGSFLRGYLYAERTKDNPIIINGRGIISNDTYPFHYPEKDPLNKVRSAGWYKTIQIEGGKNHYLEGITIVNATAFNIILKADSSTIRNVNINGFKHNNDGITPIGKNNTIDGCFIRVNDDAIVLYGDSHSIKNCTFWQLANGSNIQLGWYINMIKGNNIIHNCDVMHAEWSLKNKGDIGFITAMYISPNPSASHNTTAIVENFKVSDIFFDEPIERFINIRPVTNFISKENRMLNWHFKNFTFCNIHLKIRKGKADPINYFNYSGLAPLFENLTFNDIYINGKAINAFSHPTFLDERMRRRIVVGK